MSGISIAAIDTGGSTNVAGAGVFARSVTWNPSPDTNVVGYKIYYGTASQVYTTNLVVGNVTNASSQTLNGATVNPGFNVIGASNNTPTLNLGAFNQSLGAQTEFIGPAYDSNPTGGTATVTTMGDLPSQHSTASRCNFLYSANVVAAIDALRPAFLAGTAGLSDEHVVAAATARLTDEAARGLVPGIDDDGAHVARRARAREGHLEELPPDAGEYADRGQDGYGAGRRAEPACDRVHEGISVQARAGAHAGGHTFGRRARAAVTGGSTCEAFEFADPG